MRSSIQSRLRTEFLRASDVGPRAEQSRSNPKNHWFFFPIFSFSKQWEDERKRNREIMYVFPEDDMALYGSMLCYAMLCVARLLPGPCVFVCFGSLSPCAYIGVIVIFEMSCCFQKTYWCNRL